jgi:hypothetical protein
MTPARSEAPTLDTVKALRVLFVGNSYVDRNDLPGLVASLQAKFGTGNVKVVEKSIEKRA